VDGSVAITGTSHVASKTEIVVSFDSSKPEQFPFHICVDGAREVERDGNISWGACVRVVGESQQAATGRAASAIGRCTDFVWTWRATAAPVGSHHVASGRGLGVARTGR
jgi:hypothetical protein